MEGIENNPKVPNVEIPDTVVQGGLSEVLRFIHKESALRPAGLRRHIPDVGTDSTRDALAQLSTADARTVEVNAIAAHVIASVWPAMNAWNKEHPGKIARSADFEATEITEVKEGSLTPRFLMSHELGFRDLRQYAIDMCQYYVMEEVHQRTVHGDPAVARLRALVSDPAYNTYRNDATQVVLAGFVTANDMIWGLLNSIPRAFRQQYGNTKQLTPVEYEGLARSAKELALTMATTQLNVFGSIVGKTQGSNYNAYLSKLDLNGLRIIEAGGRSRLDFAPDILRAIAADYLSSYRNNVQRVRTGCPALFVSGEEGANVISDYFDWCYGLAKKYYIPTLEA